MTAVLCLSFAGEALHAQDKPPQEPRAFARGASVDWPAVYAETDSRRVDLPSYAFQRERYWVTDSAPPEAGSPPGAAARCCRG